MTNNNFELMKNSDMPIVGGIYRHFKGGLYQVLTIATDEAQGDRRLVIYRGIEEGSVWARELSSFMSDRDKIKHPNYTQEKTMEFMSTIK